MVTFRVPDMTCGHCASAIARAVAAVDRAARIDVTVADKLVSIASGAADAEGLSPPAWERWLSGRAGHASASWGLAACPHRSTLSRRTVRTVLAAN